MKSSTPDLISSEQSIYLSGGQDDKVVKITKDTETDVPSLQSNQEEADTRIILPAVAATNSGANIIVVRSPDTDTPVLFLHHRPDIHAEKIYFLTGRDGSMPI